MARASPPPRSSTKQVTCRTTWTVSTVMSATNASKLGTSFSYLTINASSVKKITKMLSCAVSVKFLIVVLLGYILAKDIVARERPNSHTVHYSIIPGLNALAYHIYRAHGKVLPIRIRPDLFLPKNKANIFGTPVDFIFGYYYFYYWVDIHGCDI